MRSKRMIFSVAAMLVAAVLALSACGGQEAPAPEKTAEQQVLFDVTQFIGVDEEGLVAIMGEPDKLHVNQSNNKEYTYKDITYMYNGEQHVIYDTFFLLSEREDGTYKINYLDLDASLSSTEKSQFFKFEPREDIFALFGIETDVQISEEQPQYGYEKYEDVMDGIDYILLSSFDKTGAEWTIGGIAVYYVK